MPDDNTAERQKALATYIGKTYCRTDKLIPLERHSQFCPVYLTGGSWLDVFADRRLCDLALEVVAFRFCNVGKLDHAWRFGWPDGPKEPWGFVNEPYTKAETAREIALAAGDLMPDWGVSFHALEPERGSWNPPSCVPIVAVVDDYKTFIRQAVSYALTY